VQQEGVSEGYASDRQPLGTIRLGEVHFLARISRLPALASFSALSSPPSTTVSYLAEQFVMAQW